MSLNIEQRRNIWEGSRILSKARIHLADERSLVPDHSDPRCLRWKWLDPNRKMAFDLLTRLLQEVSEGKL